MRFSKVSKLILCLSLSLMLVFILSACTNESGNIDSLTEGLGLLQLRIEGEGLVEINGNKTVENEFSKDYETGEIVKLRAKSNKVAWRFTGWSGSLEGNESLKKLPINSSSEILVQANFARTSKIIKVAELADYSCDIHFSSDGTELLSATGEGTIKLWDVETRTTIEKFGNGSSYIRALDFASDGSKLASGTENGIVKVWDKDMKSKILEFKGFSCGVEELAFNLNGDRLAGINENGTVKVWNIEQEEKVGEFNTNNSGYTATFSPDGTKLAIVNWDKQYHQKQVEVWNVEKKEKTAEFQHSNVSSLAFNLEGTKLASGSYDSTIKVFNLETKREVVELLGPSLVEGDSGNVNSLAFSPDGEQLASGSGDDTVNLWDIKTGKEVAKFTGNLADEVWENTVSSMKFCPDGSNIAIGTRNETIKLLK